MSYTLIEQDQAIQTFKQQLENIRSTEGKWHVIAPLLIDNFTISFKQDKIMLKITDISEMPDSPNWMDTEYESNIFEIECLAERFQIEILYLIMHIWRELKINESANVNDVLTASFKFLKFRWSTSGEPKSDEEQRGFIGELLALSWVIQEKGEQYIAGWDSSGHAANDIETVDFNVEAKSKTKSSSSVKISFKEQLTTYDDKSVYLSVTNVNGNKESGETLPQIKNKVLKMLTDSGLASVTELNMKIESWGLTDAIEHKFVSRYKVSKTEIFEIKEDQGCSLFANLELPEGVKLEGGYRLSLSSIKSSRIEENQIYPLDE